MNNIEESILLLFTNIDFIMVTYKTDSIFLPVKGSTWMIIFTAGDFLIKSVFFKCFSSKREKSTEMVSLCEDYFQVLGGLRYWLMTVYFDFQKPRCCVW